VVEVQQSCLDEAFSAFMIWFQDPGLGTRLGLNVKAKPNNKAKLIQ